MNITQCVSQLREQLKKQKEDLQEQLKAVEHLEEATRESIYLFGEMSKYAQMLMRGERKIPIIKEIRNDLGLGLKEAKTMADQMYDDLGYNSDGTKKSDTRDNTIKTKSGMRVDLLDSSVSNDFRLSVVDPSGGIVDAAYFNADEERFELSSKGICFQDLKDNILHNRPEHLSFVQWLDICLQEVDKSLYTNRPYISPPGAQNHCSDMVPFWKWLEKQWLKMARWQKA